MRKTRFFYLLSIFIALNVALSACSALSQSGEPTPTTGPILLTDGLNREIIFDKPATRVISIAPSNTEVLFAVGAGSQVVGRDEFSDYPQQVTEITNVGGGFGQLNTEAMVALTPDLVLASELTPAEQVDAIEKLGMKVYLLPNPQTIEEMYENLRVVGQITGHSQDADKLIAELTTRVKAIDDMLAAVEERPLVFYELDSTDPNAPWTAGMGTFIDTLISRAGGLNVGGKLQDPYAQISIEQLLLDQPDVIVLGDYTWGGVTPEDVAARQGWTDLDAVKQEKIYTFDDNLVSRPGPRMVDGLELLAKLLHPDLFK